MKMLSGHVEELRQLLTPLDTPERRGRYLAGNFHNADKCKNVDMRYRWDLVYALHAETQRLLMNKLYMYLNDDHIDTALRSIVPALDKGGESGVPSTGWVGL